MLLKIGITERGDAGIDFSWYDKLDTVDGAIIITKKLSDAFIDKLLTASKPVILHCSCTGWGGTWLEPNNPSYKDQLSLLSKLIQKGFPAENIVLRIDPIFPTEEGIAKACAVLDHVIAEKLPISRFRISIYDEYNHSRQRIIASGHPAFYGGSFYASQEMIKNTIDALKKYPFMFETCAEDFLSSRSIRFISAGCIGRRDLAIMGLAIPNDMTENPQNRKGCHCLGCKTELLERRAQCPNGCLYCYWK